MNVHALGVDCLCFSLHKATWRCPRGGMANEQFRLFYFPKNMNKNLIKFIFLLSYSTFFVQSINAVTSPDFIAYSKEGTALKFRIKNESTKVCALYGEHENKKVMVTSSGAVYRDYYYTCCEEIGEHLTIPEIVNGYTVTSIDNWAFYGRTITSITIPQTIAYIGEYNQEIKGVTNVEVIPVSA